MKEINSTKPPANAEQAPTWSRWLWFAGLLLVLLIVAVIGTAWSVRQVITAGGPRFSVAQSRFIIFLAEFPAFARTAAKEAMSRIENDPEVLLIDRRETEQSNWVRHFPSSDDPGYLLLSGVDPSVKHSIVQLLRISDGKRVALWDPDWAAVIKLTDTKSLIASISLNTVGAVHPALLADGDIVFNTGLSLVRLSPCSSKPVWVLDEIMHHSNEIDANGDIWVPSVSLDGFSDNIWLRDHMRDDAIAHVSADGQLLSKQSFSRILIDNGLRALLLGTSHNHDDPIHMNEIQVAPRNTKYWKQGDLLISSRGLSSIFLYRPSTGKILWHQTGPWMNQHSVDFVDDHRISVYDNNVIIYAPKKYSFLSSGDSNRVLLYDFDTGQISQPFETLLAKAHPVSISQGRARVLPDGGLFIEETDAGRHLRFTLDRLMWSRVNDYDEKRIGMVLWSRYLTAEEVKGPLLALSSHQCAASTSSAK